MDVGLYSKTSNSNYRQIISTMIFKLPTEIAIQKLLKQEDTDGDKKITVDDCGPKSFIITNTIGDEIAIEGTFYLSNLLQELALAKKQNLEFATIDMAHIQENAVDRISRKIRNNLTIEYFNRMMKYLLIYKFLYLK